MSKCIKKIKHEECGGGGLQVFADEEGNIDGFCFSCDKFVPHPLGEGVKAKDIPQPKEKTKEEIKAEIAEVSGYVTVDLPTRKLRKAALDDFGVKIALSEQDGKTPTLSYWPYRQGGKITGYKVKTIGLKKKKTWSIGSLKEVDLFGWKEALKFGGKKLIITEGEEDAVAMKSIVDRFTDSRYNDIKPAVVSLPFGVTSVKSHWPRYVKQIRDAGFKDVVLCFDNDKYGEEAISQALKLLPEAKSVHLPAKDANACIIEGKSKRAFSAVTFNAEKPKNTRVILADDLFEAASEPAKYGELTYPYPTLNEITRGIRYGETIYIGAGAKMGKSELVDDLIAHFIKNLKVSVFAAKPEQANKQTIKKVAGKITGNVFHDPKVEFNREAYAKACSIMSGKLRLVNMYQNLGWDTLQLDIREAVALGCRVIMIDPITNLTNGMNSADANVKLQEIAQNLSQMALDLDVVIFIFCHLKSPEGNISKDQREAKYKKGLHIGLGNCPHEYGGDVLSAQFAGSRAMMRSCNYMIGLEGNKDPIIEDTKIRNTRHLKLLEDREFGESAIIPLFWNRHTTNFTEI